MSFLAQYPGRWAAGILTLGGTYLYLAKPPAPREEFPVTFSTTGVNNIEKAYTNAGATPSHTPAYGGTTMGKKEDVALKEEGSGTGSRAKNMQSAHNQEGVGSDQRPASAAPTKIEEAFNQTNIGSTKGERTILFQGWGVFLWECFANV